MKKNETAIENRKFERVLFRKARDNKVNPAESDRPGRNPAADNDLVGNGAAGMVETTMEEVGKGHYLGMKYLFEMIGLYPATSADDGPVEDSLAATLLRRLGIPYSSTPDAGVTKDSTMTGVSASEDVLE